jgi:hypothetical protein
MNLHEIARHGTGYDIESYFERLKANSSVDSEEFQEYVRSFVNTKNDHKYSPLHCSIFSRFTQSILFYHHHSSLFLEEMSAHFLVSWTLVVM